MHAPPDPSPIASSGCRRTARTGRTATRTSCPPRSRTGSLGEQLSADIHSHTVGRPWVVGLECCPGDCRGTSWPWRCLRTRCHPRTPHRRSRRRHHTASSSLSRGRKEGREGGREGAMHGLSSSSTLTMQLASSAHSPTCLIHPLGESSFYDRTLLIGIAVYIGLLLVCFRKEDRLQSSV